jgi:hypothetical protein
MSESQAGKLQLSKITTTSQSQKLENPIICDMRNKNRKLTVCLALRH